MKPWVFAVMLVAVSGCLPESKADGCGAADLKYLVGRDGAILEVMRFAKPTRVLKFGQAMTMDFNPGRLNIQLAPAGRIARVWCG